MKTLTELHFLAVILLFSNGLKAQENAPTFFAGSADMYYKYDFSEQDNGLTSFTNSHDSFQIGMLSLEASHQFGKASVYADLGFGNRAAQFSYHDGAATFMIKQLNVTYQFNKSFKIVAGSFGTHIGYELVDAVDNKNYSMSYGFSYGPFFNTGVKAILNQGKFNYMLGITNPTDFKSAIEAGSTQKTIIGQVAYTGDKESAYFNFSSGSSNPSSQKNKTQLDFVGTKKVNDKWNLAFNATYNFVTDDHDASLDGNWYSVAGYASCLLKNRWSLAYRLEYFDDNDGVVAFVDGASVLSNTFSLNFKEGNFTFIPEIRIDSASKEIFTIGSQNKINTFGLIGAAYNF